MSEKTAIQWTDKTWNPWHGCKKVSEGCRFCYMYRDKERYGQDPTTVLRSKTTFNDPLKWTEPAKVFTCSWSDWFIADADEWRSDAWNIIKRTPHLTYQILTKRPENIADRLPADWGEGYPNVWLGVSVENQEAADERIHQLINTPAAIRFLSVEPILEAIDFFYYGGDHGDPISFNKLRGTDATDPDIPGVDWVIVGGESGNETGKWRYRPIDLFSISAVVSSCQSAGVPVFVKQLGTHLAKQMGLKDSHGGDINEFPAGLRIREFPA